MTNSALNTYFVELKKAQELERERTGKQAIGRVETPKGCCNTLWIPVDNSNRSATINLNHVLVGFDEKWQLWGENGNCGTKYLIIALPANWYKAHEDKLLIDLSEKVHEKMGTARGIMPHKLLVVENLPLIQEAMKEVSEELDAQNKGKRVYEVVVYVTGGFNGQTARWFFKGDNKDEALDNASLASNVKSVKWRKDLSPYNFLDHSEEDGMLSHFVALP